MRRPHPLYDPPPPSVPEASRRATGAPPRPDTSRRTTGAPRRPDTSPRTAAAPPRPEASLRAHGAQLREPAVTPLPGASLRGEESLLLADLAVLVELGLIEPRDSPDGPVFALTELGREFPGPEIPPQWP
jgi:hypothetical protein